MSHTVNLLDANIVPFVACTKRNHFDCKHSVLAGVLAGHHRGVDAAPLSYVDGWTCVAELTTLCVQEHDFTILEHEIERLENVGMRDAFDQGAHDALLALVG